MPATHLDDRIAALRADATRGATAVSRDAAGTLHDAATLLSAGGASELTAALTALTLRILDAQPSMAPLVSLARDVLLAIDAQADVAELRRRAAEAALAFVRRIDSATALVGERAARLLPTEGPVLTLSASSAVAAALGAALRKRPLEVICLESRPLNEGRELATALAAAGARVTVAVDAAAESLLDRGGAVLLGADSIGDAGVVNKIGSTAAARAAERHRVPVYVVADPSKLLPPGFPQRVDDDRPGEEVWPDPGAVRLWNRYFEVVPGELITLVVLEDGQLTLSEVDRRRSDLTVPERLSEWAASRSDAAGGARAGHRT